MNKKADTTNDTVKEVLKEKPLSLADKIWSEIKGKQLEMFALPKQFVEMYCEPIMIEPSKLYLKFTVPAVLPALEVALGEGYLVDLVDKYICVSYSKKN